MRGETTSILAIAALALGAVWAAGCQPTEVQTMPRSEKAATPPQASSDEQKPRDSGRRETAQFAAGCFWGVEEAFRQMSGVTATTVGYTGGKTESPTYADVCTDRTGHAETVEVKFDPEQVTYEQLLEVFWKSHDPTQKNRQGPDVGTQYRSAIFFYLSDEQKRAAEASKAALEKSGKYSRPITTEIVPAGIFWKAEEYHQQYLEKHGMAVCPSHLK